MRLRLEDVHTHYGLVHMLKGVSMEVDAGELVAILGRNGAGKTTTIKSVMGLAPPTDVRPTLDSGCQVPPSDTNSSHDLPWRPFTPHGAMVLKPSNHHQ